MHQALKNFDIYLAVVGGLTVVLGGLALTAIPALAPVAAIALLGLLIGIPVRLAVAALVTQGH